MDILSARTGSAAEGSSTRTPMDIVSRVFPDRKRSSWVPLCRANCCYIRSLLLLRQQLADPKLVWPSRLWHRFKFQTALKSNGQSICHVFHVERNWFHNISKPEMIWTNLPWNQQSVPLSATNLALFNISLSWPRSSASLLHGHIDQVLTAFPDFQLPKSKNLTEKFWPHPPAQASLPYHRPVKEIPSDENTRCASSFWWSIVGKPTLNSP